MTGIHCIHNVLLTGGKVKLFESRDAFAKEGSAFERAQIVRLDSRQIAMLRYHLGTGFEDVYIPSVGETDAHMGNILYVPSVSLHCFWSMSNLCLFIATS
jgi:hypothetical protein